MKKLSIIIPMYNETDIYENLKKAVKIFDSFRMPYEIIVVNDGSTDNCLKEARRLKSGKIRIVGYKKNMGKGNAIRYGFNFVKGDYVAFVDADLELNPIQLKSFLKIMGEKNADIVIGSKREALSRVYYPLSRKILSKFYQLLLTLFFGLNIKDTQVGLKLFKTEVLKKVFPKIIVKRFAFDLELLVIARKLNYKIAEAPIELRYKFGSSVDLRAVGHILLDTIAIFYRLKILRWYDRK